MRIVSGTLFAISEFMVSKITLDVIATPRPDLTAEMKLQLKGEHGYYEIKNQKTKLEFEIEIFRKFDSLQFKENLNNYNF